jgi:CIC family chloride channel protein
VTEAIDREAETRHSGDGLPALLCLSIAAGASAGFICAAFRIALDQANRLRNALIIVEHQDQWIGLLVFMGLSALATFIAAWLVKTFSVHASGSGIPHVEASLQRLVPVGSPLLIPVKFFGGALGIGAGLALGREGPSVQMGAVIAHEIGRLARRPWGDCRVLLAAGAGAGLATAFNAPIAGAVFVLEELVQRFEHRIALCALSASAAGIVVSHLFLSEAPAFRVPDLDMPPATSLPAFVLFGFACGVIGIIYFRVMLGTLGLFRSERAIGAPGRAALTGAVVGALAWRFPHLVGGGETLAQTALLGAGDFASLVLIFIFRLILGAVSYAIETPGGMFAPMLALGAELGVIFSMIAKNLGFVATTPAPAFALVGMTALFSGVVRAPLTGIVLVTEMTANTSMLVPMLCACAAAMTPPLLGGVPPLYEALRDLVVERERRARTCPDPTPAGAPSKGGEESL